MRNSMAFRFGLAVLMVGGVYAGIAFARIQVPSTSLKTYTTLQAPAFLQVAHADSSDVLARIDEEAGISAYFKASDVINLSLVRSGFRTVELETGDYILGSMLVPGYPEHFEMHVYVHKTGWILAYYPRNAPISKIVDIRANTINTSKLKTVIAGVASAAGAPFTDVAYYDFRYPSATNLLLISDASANGNGFTLKLPSNYGYFERSYSYVNGGCCGGPLMNLDGSPISNLYWDGSGYGALNASQLLPDVVHTISVPKDDYRDNTYLVLVIAYRVP